MHTFTIDDTTYLPFKNSLYILKEQVEDINELEENTLYLHLDTVGTFSIKKDYSSFDVIFEPNTNVEKAYYMEDQSQIGGEFGSAIRLEQVVPDELMECPQCGNVAGEKDNEDTPVCLRCGYGTEEGVIENET